MKADYKNWFPRISEVHYDGGLDRELPHFAFSRSQTLGYGGEKCDL